MRLAREPSVPSMSDVTVRFQRCTCIYDLRIAMCVHYIKIKHLTMQWIFPSSNDDASYVNSSCYN